MIQNFRTYNLAVSLCKDARQTKLTGNLKDQLLRATQSIVLNLAEGAAKPTNKDQMKFFAIAFGSVREVQAIQDLTDQDQRDDEYAKKLDHLAASLYKLVYKANNPRSL